MSYTVNLSFNSNAHADYAGTDQTWTGVWSVGLMTNVLMINLKADGQSPDSIILLPWAGISKCTYVPEGDALG